MDQEYSSAFYGWVAPFYDWIFGKAMEPGRREVGLRVRSGERVLEVGVGTGLGLRHYPSGCAIVGVDICPQMLRRARWRALVDGNGSTVELHRMDAMSLRFPDESFDVVVAPYVVTTVGDPERVCEEMRRVCRPGGRVIVLSNIRERGTYGALKARLSPWMEKVGFVTDLDVLGVLDQVGLQVVEDRRVNLLGLHKLLVATRQG